METVEHIWVVVTVLSGVLAYLGMGFWVAYYVFHAWEKPLFVRIPVCVLMPVFWLPVVIASAIRKVQ